MKSSHRGKAAGLALAVGLTAAAGFATSPTAPDEAPSTEVAAERFLQPDLDVLQGERFERKILALEGREEWKKIAWRKDARSALADAAKLGKPVLVLLTVAEFGKDHAAFT